MLLSNKDASFSKKPRGHCCPVIEIYFPANYGQSVISIHIGSEVNCENSKLTSLPMCGFIAQVVEHRTGIAEVTGSNPVFSGFQGNALR